MSLHHLYHSQALASRLQHNASVSPRDQSRPRTTDPEDSEALIHVSFEWGVAQELGSPSRSFGDNPQDIFPGMTLRIVNEENTSYKPSRHPRKNYTRRYPSRSINAEERSSLMSWKLSLQMWYSDFWLPEKLAQRCKAKDNRSKKTDAHYLGRTSYAEKEEICMPDRVELYVDACKNPKTKLCHPGAVFDVGSIETDALTRHFGKYKRGHTRGVGSTVARTKLKATLPIRNKLEQMKASGQSTNDLLDDLKSTMSHLLKVVQGMNPSSNPESGASHIRTNAEVGVIPIVHCSKKSATGSPSTPTSGPSKSYKLMNLDGSKSIAQVTIVKIARGSLVHGRPLFPFEVKVVVVKVFPGMGDKPLWKGNQGGADTVEETEGGYLVWPKYLMEEVTGDYCVVIVEEPVDCPNVSVIACKYASIFQDCLQHSSLPIWNRLNNTGFWRQLTEILVMVQICSMGFEDEVVNSELEQMAQAFAAGGDSSHDHIPLACKDSVAMIFMFDLTSRCTLNSILSWYQQARKWNQAAFIGTKLIYFPETLLHGRKDDELKIFEHFDGPIMKGYCSFPHDFHDRSWKARIDHGPPKEFQNGS
ncbi:hypothetical protein LguiB_005433 [Lonicera macranthoides]